MTLIIDTHVHVVSSDRVRYPLHPGAGQHAWYDKQPADATALLANMDSSGVHGTVMVQGHGAYSFDNSYCADAAGESRGRLVSASIIDVTSTDRETQLSYWAAERGMVGTRVFHIPRPEPAWLGDQTMLPYWQKIESLGIRPIVCILRRDLALLEQLLSWAPPVAISLDHAGLIEMPGLEATRADIDRLLALARFDNLNLKISTNVLDYATQIGLTPTRLVRELADAFTAKRLMWGSDWPQVADRPYATLVQQGIDAGDLLGEKERADYLGGTALRIWPELAP